MHNDFPARQHTHWLAVFAGILCGIAISATIGKVAINITALREDFGLSLVDAGSLSSAINLLSVSVAVVFGFFADRIGGLRLCLAGASVTLLGGLISLLASDFSLLLAGRVIEGAGYMSIAVSVPILLSAASRAADLRLVLGMWGAYMPIGIALVIGLGPLLQAAGSWRAVWLFPLLLLVLAIVLVWSQRRHYRPAVAVVRAPMGTKPALGVALEVLRTPLSWVLGLLFATWSIQHFTLIVWLPTFLREQRGLDMGWVAALSCLMVLANAPGNLLGGVLLRRGVARGKLLMIGCALSGLFMFAAFSPALPDLLRYLACVSVSLAGGLIPSSILSASTVIARTPDQIGTYQGFAMQISNLGQLLGPPLTAALVAAHGRWEDAVVLPVGAALLGFVLAAAALRLENRLTTSRR